MRAMPAVEPDEDDAVVVYRKLTPGEVFADGDEMRSWRGEPWGPIDKDWVGVVRCDDDRVYEYRRKTTLPAQPIDTEGIEQCK